MAAATTPTHDLIKLLGRDITADARGWRRLTDPAMKKLDSGSNADGTAHTRELGAPRSSCQIIRLLRSTRTADPRPVGRRPVLKATLREYFVTVFLNPTEHCQKGHSIPSPFVFCIHASAILRLPLLCF